jgi:hypothetical protein
VRLARIGSPRPLLSAMRDRGRSARRSTREAELEALEESHGEKVAVARAEHEAGVRRQKALLAEPGVAECDAR